MAVGSVVARRVRNGSGMSAECTPPDHATGGSAPGPVRWPHRSAAVEPVGQPGSGRQHDVDVVCGVRTVGAAGVDDLDHFAGARLVHTNDAPARKKTGAERTSEKGRPAE